MTWGICGRATSSGREDFYFTITIENALSEFKKSPLEALDRLIETNALELLEQNPFLVPNAEAIDWKSPERKTEPVPWFNAYPMQFDTEELFPRLLAICRGEDSLEHVLYDMRQVGSVRIRSESQVVRQMSGARDLHGGL